MSQAHRPTWAPAMGKERKTGSAAILKQRDFSDRTKLKFRQPGQTAAGDVARRDLKAELLRAEREAMDKKRKAQGLPPLVDEVQERAPAGLIANGSANGDGVAETEEDEQARKRRKILEEVKDLDKDDSDDESDGEANAKSKGKGKGKERATGEDAEDGVANGGAGDDDDEDEDEDSDDDSDEEDDTAALMAELNKIKRERAEEKARQEREAAASSAVDRETEIALGNPLLNLQAALGQSPLPGSASPAPSSTAGGSTGSFAVKRRWDDDLIFKNQASGQDLDGKGKKEFVNDLLRTEFHRKFMAKFIK